MLSVNSWSPPEIHILFPKSRYSPPACGSARAATSDNDEPACGSESHNAHRSDDRCARVPANWAHFGGRRGRSCEQALEQLLTDLRSTTRTSRQVYEAHRLELTHPLPADKPAIPHVDQEMLERIRVWGGTGNATSDEHPDI
jgi:hypothetical protein